jgi:23S rRNA U2552 (ribose-2'-O)-methylase RlmE/FtsJ
MLKETKFLLPQATTLKFKQKKEDRFAKVSILGYRKEIDETKNKISKLSNETWTRLRKMTNPLEYPYVNTKPKPVSRAFFKLVELIKDNAIDVSGNTFHLCEAPGGFIQAIQYVLGENDTSTHYAFSLVGNGNTPSFGSPILQKNNVIVLSNNTNSGNIYFIDNIKILIRTLAPRNIKFITADGGFCESNDFSNKEQIHHHIIFNQIVASLHILANDGAMIIKIFDMYTELTFDYVYLLSYFFREVYIHKPHTSRPTNSERYLYCKGFIKGRFDYDISRTLQTLCSRNIENLSSFIDKACVPKKFTSTIRNINTYFSNYQIYSINNIIKIYELNIKIQRNTSEKDAWVKKYYV